MAKKLPKSKLAEAGPGAGKTHAMVDEIVAMIQLLPRKAKGLQADAALVVAKGIAELKKWLQTDRSLRVADKQDKCRLGYVAFTRPKEMLCIACLKEIDEELIHITECWNCDSS